MIDHRHIHIHFDLEEDFHCCWIKGLWSFDHHILRVLKWTPQFNLAYESSIVPAWVAFGALPIHRFNEEYLRVLASIIGTPLKIDVLTLNLSRPSIARVCVEVDLLHEFPKRIRVGTEELSYFQPITYENLPEYYLECEKVGHASKECRHGKARVSQPTNPKVILTKNDKQTTNTNVHSNVWKPKGKNSEGPVIIEEIGMKASSSELTAKEKERIPIDVEAKAEITDDRALEEENGESQIEKEQLNEVLNRDDDSESEPEQYNKETSFSQESGKLNSTAYARDDNAIRMYHEAGMNFLHE
ncbi:OLC1v1008504C1 [Oldenlandia corymbosa var. corymbosa]|uniref:OLC1v1008504C1 n=1 Tax=Oldenlandia corymbosa var. corymbosa TaxID=529605 RepID=A0AAV1DN97_OLDCO|nr:OLC1v1008504C1 [Oldenlandia corymbosa var. corymbosa]